MTENKMKFLLVDRHVLPAVFAKIIETKALASKYPERPISSITDEVGISRTAYYKYKDHVFPFYETSHGKVLTLFFVAEDLNGVLSSIIKVIADARGNILTISQNMPITGLADVSVSIETDKVEVPLEDLIDSLRSIDGVRKCEIIARE